MKLLIGDSVDKVHEGSHLVEQSAGIAQVSQTIVEMDETTQQNAALVEEAAAAQRCRNRRHGWRARSASSSPTRRRLNLPAREAGLALGQATNNFIPEETP
jgi:hypothetical protein